MGGVEEGMGCCGVDEGAEDVGGVGFEGGEELVGVGGG